MTGSKENSQTDQALTADSKRSGWNAKLMDALSHGTLAQLSQVARESSPLIESTYQPFPKRSSSYMASPKFDYKMRQVGEDDDR